MLTQTLHTALQIEAGVTFDWSVTKSARPHTDIRTGLREYVYNYANGLCVFCGNHVPQSQAQMCHIVSSGGPSVRRGYTPGNIANGCGPCNDTHGERFDVVPMSEIRHPELIALAWPTNVELRNRGRAIKAARVA